MMKGEVDGGLEKGNGVEVLGWSCVNGRLRLFWQTLRVRFPTPSGLLCIELSTGQAAVRSSAHANPSHVSA
ncbi:hypothetical protein V6N13_108835 [Hibiscus sabdariffa]